MRCAMHRIFTARSLSLLSILSYFSAISVLGSTDRASAESKKRTVHLVLSNHLVQSHASPHLRVLLHGLCNTPC